MGIFMMEGALQGLMSWLIAVPVSFVIAQPLARLMGQIMLDIDLDFAYNWPAVAVWLGVVIGIALCAAMFPAQNATKISVRQALAYS
jgi:putative ABC transport system permease protein